MLRQTLIIGMAVAACLVDVATASPRVGGPAPEVSATTLSGAPFDLASLRGRVVVINLWATWCPPCRAEMPALNEVYGRLHSRGLEMIGLSADKPRDQAKVRQIMAAFSYPAATAAQTHGGGLDAAASLPVTYMIDKAGVIRDVLHGGTPLTVASLEAMVMPLLEEAGVRNSLGDDHRVPLGSQAAANPTRAALAMPSQVVYRFAPSTPRS